MPVLPPNSHKRKQRNYKKRKTSVERENKKLTTIQQDVVVGSLLGDAHLERRSPNHNARLRFDQTFPNHASYIMYIFSLFYNFSGKGPKVYIRKPDKRTGKTYSTIQFKTLNFPCFNMFHDMFYKHGKKIIPSDIVKFLTPRALAIWIMDDGGKNSSNQTILHTRSYSYNEVLILQEALKLNFKLKTNLYEKVPNQWIIIIPVKQEISLRNIVMPYMHYSFLYKI